VTHRVLLTSANVTINHSHLEVEYGELTATQIASIQANALANYPGIQPVEYIRLNHTSETLLPTRRYNCWAFTFNPRQCWIDDGSDVQNILNANGTQVFPPNVRVGDVICYRDASNTITHTGRVWSLSPASQPALIQSKWGPWGEYIHAPLTVPASYGTNVTYWRVTPIWGKGDAWVKDHAGDDRLVEPPGIDLYLSPDLWCNNSGGTFHENPVRAQPNQLWVRVHNADTLAITGATVRVYWSDPTGGMPHTDWHAIGTVSVSVPATTLGGSPNTVVAGPIPWTPGMTEPNHCCLFAIVDTGDDPFAAATLDPIVWPWDVARDNNIVWKNMWIVPMPSGPSETPTAGGGGQGGAGKPVSLDFVAKNVMGFAAPIEVRVTMRQIGPQEVLDMGLDPAIARVAEGVTPKLDRQPLAIAKEAKFRSPFRPGPVARPKVRVSVRPEGEFWARSRGGDLSQKAMVLTMPKVPPGKGGRLRLEVAPISGAQPGEVYRLDLRQKVAGHPTGGGAYVIVIKG